MECRGQAAPGSGRARSKRPGPEPASIETIAAVGVADQQALEHLRRHHAAATAAAAAAAASREQGWRKGEDGVETDVDVERFTGRGGGGAERRR